MTNLKLPQWNKFIQKIMHWWFWWWAWYLEYQKSKKIADAMADNEANKVKIAWEIEEKVIREKISMIESLEMADKFIEYENLYNTLTKTVPKIDLNSEWNIDIDKMKRLKDLSKEFSSDEMQDIIAWILAWEYNKPWSYSLKTMEVVKNLTKYDIELFRKFCWIVIDWDFYFWNFFNQKNHNLLKLIDKGIDYNNYLYLQELWLLNDSNSARILWADSSEKNYTRQFIISNTPLNLGLSHEINFSFSLLTKAWKELYKLVNPIFDEELFLMCKNELIKQWFEEIK